MLEKSLGGGGGQKAPLELVPNFTTGWQHLHFFSKFDHQKANFATRWHYFGLKFDHQVDLMSHMHCHIALDCPIGSFS